MTYPPAALFGLAIIKATLHHVYEAAAIDTGVSGYYLVNAMARMAEHLETLVESQDWAIFQTFSLAVMAAWVGGDSRLDAVAQLSQAAARTQAAAGQADA